MEPEFLPPLLTKVKTSPLAIWSLVLGCLGLVLLLVCIGPLFAVAAVICGHLAYSRIKRSEGAFSGQGMAVAGLITGYVSIGLSVFLIPMMLAVAFPNFVKARDSAQKGICINNLRMIDGAKQACALEKKMTAEDIPTPDDLAPYLQTKFSALRCPSGGTYTINIVSESPTCSIAGHKLPLGPAGR
jgi:hypothetical protein